MHNSPKNPDFVFKAHLFKGVLGLSGIVFDAFSTFYILYVRYLF